MNADGDPSGLYDRISDEAKLFVNFNVGGDLFDAVHRKHETKSGAALPSFGAQEGAIMVS